MDYKNMLISLEKTNDIKELERIIKAYDFEYMPYYYLQKVKDILHEKSNYLIKRKANIKALMVFITILITLILAFPSSYFISFILKLIVAILGQKLCIRLGKNFFTKEIEVKKIDRAVWDKMLDNLDIKICDRGKEQNPDYSFFQKSNEEAIKNVYEKKENKYNNVTNEEIEFNMNLIGKLNEVIEMDDIALAYQSFLDISEDIRVNQSKMAQDFAFNILPKYFLLLVEKDNNTLGIHKMVSKLDPYLLVIVFKYLCVQMNYLEFKSYFLFTKPYTLNLIVEALLENHLENINNKDNTIKKVDVRIR